MRNTRAMIMMVVAIGLAFVAVVAGARWINAQATTSTSKVAVAQVDINLGSRLTPDMVRLVDWPASVQPPGAIKDDKQLDGRVARTSITRGETSVRRGCVLRNPELEHVKSRPVMPGVRTDTSPSGTKP